jgi:hypothetical protein
MKLSSKIDTFDTNFDTNGDYILIYPDYIL